MTFDGVISGGPAECVGLRAATQLTALHQRFLYRNSAEETIYPISGGFLWWEYQHVYGEHTHSFSNNIFLCCMLLNVAVSPLVWDDL